MRERSDYRLDSRADPLVRSADEMVGTPVIDTAGNRLGRLQAIMIEVPDGRIAYVVVAFSAPPGANGRLHAVPWQLLETCDAASQLLLAVELEALRSAPALGPED